MIDREPLMREAPQRQRHQIAVVGSLTGRPGPLRAIRRLALCGKPTHPRPSGAGIWGIPDQTFKRSDLEAVLSDWLAVGDDLRRAMREFDDRAPRAEGQENPKQQAIGREGHEFARTS